MSDNIVRKWKKKTYMTIDVLLEDEFYARTPDLNKTYPPSNKAVTTILEKHDTRSTLEEIPIEDEPNEKVTEEVTSVDKQKPAEV